MNKREYFLKAMQAEEFRRKAWVISAFALTREAPDAYKADPYPYRLIQTPAGYFFVDPDNNNQLSPIEGGRAGEPLFGVKETLMIGVVDKIPNFISEVKTMERVTETTYGRLLWNYVVTIHGLKGKVPYQNQRTMPKDIEAMILPRRKPNPENPADMAVPADMDAVERAKLPIYVEDYVAFCDAIFYLTGFTQLCVPTATPKMIVPPKGLDVLRKKLLEEYKDRLDDPSVIATIDAELVKFDKEYMKGDLSDGFLLSDKAFKLIRKRLFGMVGADQGLRDTVKADAVTNSLVEGVDVNKLPTLINVARASSYRRGAETQKGGESVKWLLRASSNMSITVDDCGSKLGEFVPITEKNKAKLVGFTLVAANGTHKIQTIEDADHYVGKTVMVRSPMYCQLDKTDYCKTCAGDQLSENPNGLSAAVSDYGNKFLYISLKSAHGSALELVKLDVKSSIL